MLAVAAVGRVLLEIYILVAGHIRTLLSHRTACVYPPTAFSAIMLLKMSVSITCIAARIVCSTILCGEQQRNNIIDDVYRSHENIVLALLGPSIPPQASSPLQRYERHLTFLLRLEVVVHFAEMSWSPVGSGAQSTVRHIHIASHVFRYRSSMEKTGGLYT